MGLTKKSVYKRFTAEDKLIHENFNHTLNIPQHDNNLTFYPIWFSKSGSAHSLPLLHNTANTHRLLITPCPSGTLHFLFCITVSPVSHLFQ